jgi:hypothetical protein
MSGHTVVHTSPGVSLKAHVLNTQNASIRRWRFTERREAIATLLFEGRQQIWVTEEAARDGKRRSLIDDNPASG